MRDYHAPRVTKEAWGAGVLGAGLVLAFIVGTVVFTWKVIVFLFTWRSEVLEDRQAKARIAEAERIAAEKEAARPAEMEAYAADRERLHQIIPGLMAEMVDDVEFGLNYYLTEGYGEYTWSEDEKQAIMDALIEEREQAHKAVTLVPGYINEAQTREELTDTLDKLVAWWGNPLLHKAADLSNHNGMTATIWEVSIHPIFKRIETA